MAEFERGDIVVYVHPQSKPTERGALAIIEKVQVLENSKYLVDVKWVSINSYLQEIFRNSDEPESFWSTDWEPISFEKVGHLDGF